MILVALVALAATALGVAADRHLSGAPTIARRTLQTMLYVMVPFVSYVNIAHLEITASGGVGLALGWIVIGVVAVVTAVAGRRLLGLDDRRLGAVLVSAVVANTGYLGNPMITVLLGTRALRYGIAWDQLVGGPALFVLGFGFGAAYGDRGGEAGRVARLRAFVTRNPPLWGVVAGLLVPARFAPAPLPSISHVVVDAMLVTGFFAAGVFLSSERRHEHAPLLQAPDRAVLTVLGARLLAAPLLLLALSGLVVSVPRPYLVQAFMPTGLNALIVGQAYGLDQRLIATAILWGSMLVLAAGIVLSFT